MSKQSHYSILVSEITADGASQFVFHTDSALYKPGALRLLKLLREKFPAPAYTVSMVYWDIVGRSVEEKEELANGNDTGKES